MRCISKIRNGGLICRGTSAPTTILVRALLIRAAIVLSSIVPFPA
jgi:hypothetical protein